MTRSEKPVVLPGSEPTPIPGARAIGPVDPDETMTVTVTVRPRSPVPTDAEIEAMSLRPVGDRAYLGREALGADPDDLRQVEDFARHHGLTVVKADGPTRSVILKGKVADFQKAFGVTLSRFQHPGGVYRGASSPLHVPATLVPVIESVLGLDDHPVASPRA